VNKVVAHRASQLARLVRVLLLRKARLGIPRWARARGLPLAHTYHLQVSLMCGAAERACPSLWRGVVTTCYLFSQPTFLGDVGQAATEVLATP
jgi:hypothetical protein